MSTYYVLGMVSNSPDGPKTMNTIVIPFFRLGSAGYSPLPKTSC